MTKTDPDQHWCLRSMRAGISWRPGDWWPAHCPAAPAPWSPVRVSAPDPGMTTEKSMIVEHFYIYLEIYLHIYIIYITLSEPGVNNR